MERFTLKQVQQALLGYITELTCHSNGRINHHQGNQHRDVAIDNINLTAARTHRQRIGCLGFRLHSELHPSVGFLLCYLSEHHSTYHCKVLHSALRLTSLLVHCQKCNQSTQPLCGATEPPFSNVLSYM